MGHSASTFRFPSWGSVSAKNGRLEYFHFYMYTKHWKPSLIFCSSSSKVGSMSSHPSGGGFLLLFTFGIVYFESFLSGGSRRTVNIRKLKMLSTMPVIQNINHEVIKLGPLLQWEGSATESFLASCKMNTKTFENCC